MILASHAALTDRLARAEAALEATARGCEAAVGAFEHNNAIDWNELDVAALAARAYFAALAEGGAKEGET
jgi:hypothetical protein